MMKLTESDHEMLLGLIQGEEPKELAPRLGMTYTRFMTRMARMKKCLEVKTVYQLIALEMVYLMEIEYKKEGIRSHVKRIGEVIIG